MKSSIKLFGDISITNLKTILVDKTAIIADLHLGYELAMTEQGIFLPTCQYEEIRKNLKQAISKYKPEMLIINGDFKHDFSKPSPQEWREIEKILKFLAEHIKKVVIIKGNHDNYLLNITSKFSNVEFCKEDYVLNDILITHGHLDNIKYYAYKTIIIAHEHPSITLRDDLDIGIKIPCFLYGTFKKQNIVVMPAFSPLAAGTDVSNQEKSSFFSPLLKKFDIDEFNVVGVAEDELIELNKLKKIKTFKELLYLFFTFLEILLRPFSVSLTTVPYSL